MTASIFRSPLANFFDQFVRYKRALNRKYCADAEVLRLFDRYLDNCHIAGWQAIDSVLVDDFLRSRPRVTPSSYNHLLGVLRRFFTFAIMQQWVEQNPVTACPRHNTGGRIPYLFDLSAAKRLLAAARSLPERPRARYRGLVYETVFALLYGLGLRVGEVTRLKLPDADLTRDMLFIRETKFNKSRIVPMGPQLAQRVKRYVEIRYGSTAAPELGLRGAMEQRTDLSGSTKPSFCRTVCLTLAEATSGVIFGTNNWFVESKFSFLPSWRVT